MVNRTSWTSGLGQGLTYGSLFNSSDLTSLPTTDSVLSTIADIANGTKLDLYMDISYKLVIASSTIASGANISFWIANLNQDNTTYGDGQFAAGTQLAATPSFAPAAALAIPPLAATTNIWGTITGIIIPPGSFRMIVQNNSGFALTAGTQTIQYRTYDLNLNA